MIPIQQKKLPLVPLLTASLMVLLVFHAKAQTKIYNIDNNAATGACNRIPFGDPTPSSTWSNQKYQTIMTSSSFGNKAGIIGSLGFAACFAGTKKFKTIEIKMGYFPGTGSTLTTTFSNNISKAATVLSARNYVFHATQNQWAHVGLQKPFFYSPQVGHLVVEITVTGAEGSSSSTTSSFYGGSNSRPTLQRMFAFGWVGSPPPTGRLDSLALKMEVGFEAWALDTYGIGCQGSNGKTPKLTLTGSSAVGQTLILGLTDALPKAGMFIIVSATPASTPVDMGIFGAPSCSLYLALDLLVLTSVDANGTFLLKFQIPNQTGLIYSKLYVQCFPLDAGANAFGMSSSNYGRILIGL